ncbi:unnamed protein product [Prorocentrum cordatum]|uniref:SGNH hydrolase-type esterase domain-containing protein n=1 Tax=Prorocentrum cordatum TaxID=2364126 RepID=A0ABN9X9R2_9DINO|nr:unnamed protein product [Polarella glacialis]
MASPEAECPKTVVCFGDSNTWGAWGHADKQGQRIPYYARWTTILQRRLGNGVSVVPEGLNGRTTVLDDPVSFLNSLPDTGTVNGSRYLPACLHSHKPIDLVVLGLGANDVKTRFSLSPAEIAKGCLMLIRMIKIDLGLRPRRRAAGPGAALAPRHAPGGDARRLRPAPCSEEPRRDRGVQAAGGGGGRGVRQRRGTSPPRRMASTSTSRPPPRSGASWPARRPGRWALGPCRSRARSPGPGRPSGLGERQTGSRREEVEASQMGSVEALFYSPSPRALSSGAHACCTPAAV